MTQSSGASSPTPISNTRSLTRRPGLSRWRRSPLPRGRSSGRRIWRWTRWLLVIGSLGTALAALTGFFGGNSHLDLLAHFRVQYAALMVPGLLAAVSLRAWRSAGTLMVATCVNGAMLVPLWWSPEQPVGEGPEIRVVQVNVYKHNHDADRLRAWLDHEQADVVVAVEVDERWLAELEQLAGYRVAIVDPIAHGFGMAVLVAEDVDVIETVRHEIAPGIPVLEVAVALDGHAITVIGAHPKAPVNPNATAQRNAGIRELAAVVRAVDGSASPNATPISNPAAASTRNIAKTTRPVLLIGDLNATRWSAPFRRLLRDTQLRDSSEGFGLQSTWPQPLIAAPVPAGGIAIDHILVSDHWRVMERRIGPHIGSDHRPIIATLVLAQP